MTFSFRYRISQIKVLSIFFSALTILMTITAGCSVRHGTKPDIILITIDTLRADHLSCYGYERNCSPNIDSVAESGVRFANSYSLTNSTLPSHLSILTSTYMKDHGVFNNTLEVQTHYKGLDTYLDQLGYKSCAVVSVNHLNRQSGFGAGFDKYFDIPHDSHMDNNLTGFMRLAAETTHIAIHWLKKNHRSAKPLFLWIHYFDPHMPYLPPKPFNTMFIDKLPERLALSLDIARRKRTLADVLAMKDWNENEIAYFKASDIRHTPVKELNAMKLTDEERKAMIAEYDGEIAYTDSGIGELLDYLKESGMRENTLLIITADHGESLGEHDISFTHRSLYNPVLKVPLIFSWPGKITKARVVEQYVQTIDIAPTILELLGTETPGHFRGTSLKDLLFGNAHSYTGNSRILKFEHANFTATGVLRGKWKLIESFDSGFTGLKQIFRYRHEEQELYDLLNDPDETQNIADSESIPAVMDTLEKAHDDWFEMEKVESIIENSKSREKDIIESLKALGYIQ